MTNIAVRVTYDCGICMFTDILFMMDFDTENWGVEQTASDLDRSLFGALSGITGNKKEIKKRKLKTEQVSDFSSPVKKSKNVSSSYKIIQSDSLHGNTEDKNLSKKRKKRLKDKQRKVMKKKQKLLNKEDGETLKESSDSAIQNKNTDKNLNNKTKGGKESELLVGGKESKLVQDKNRKKKQKLKHDHDSASKEKLISHEKSKKNDVLMTDRKNNSKESFEKTEIVKNKKHKKRKKQELSSDVKKRNTDISNPVNNPSLDVGEDQLTENVKRKTKKKKQSKKTSTDTLESNPENQSFEITSNSPNQITKAKNSESEKLKRNNFSQMKTPNTTSAQKRKHSFNISELKSVLLKDTLDKSVSEPTPKKFKKSRNENEHRNQVKEKSVESKMKDKQESQVKGKKVVPSLKERMTEQLKSARFRYLNEKLYTQTSQSAYEMFQDDKEAFQVYHDGFQGQVSKWPVNPVDVIISDIKSKPKHLVVADFGCGDAKISQNVPNKVHSFDLVAVNKHVTVCDMSKVPLKDSSIDITVFCLSLMGTNLNDYLSEASRVLKKGGTLKIAEVTSRFQSTSIARFIIGVEQYGFQFMQKDTTNKMFVMMDFKKIKPPKATPAELQLDPCVYKKR